MNLNKEEFEKRINEQANDQVLFQLAAAEIIEAEKLAATKEQVEAKAKEVAEATKKKYDEVLKNNYYAYENQITYDNLIKFLLDNAKEI